MYYKATALFAMYAPIEVNGDDFVSFKWWEDYYETSTFSQKIFWVSPILFGLLRSNENRRRHSNRLSENWNSIVFSFAIFNTIWTLGSWMLVMKESSRFRLIFIALKFLKIEILIQNKEMHISWMAKAKNRHPNKLCAESLRTVVVLPKLRQDRCCLRHNCPFIHWTTDLENMVEPLKQTRERKNFVLVVHFIRLNCWNVFK